ncbi:MAG: glycosyl transferase family 28 [Methylococcales bacterium]|nr:glycosyl transferase family 28 [Methylococcales bacterium]
MIFVTVGSQLPFDRLIKTVDHWASENKTQSMFAQTGLSDYIPQHMEFSQTMTPTAYQERLKSAKLIVSHVGMGTIITALELNIPMLLLPRLAEKGEHRNDHQLATLKRFLKFSSLQAAQNEEHLPILLDQILNNKISTFESIKPTVSSELITAIRAFVSS